MESLLIWGQVHCPTWLSPAPGSPVEAIDDVVVHRLGRLTSPDHSAGLRRPVAARVQDHKKKRRWLREFGPALDL